MGIGFINGIWNDFGGCKESVRYISNMRGGYNVDAVFNATHGPGIDVVECGIGSCYIGTEPVRQLHQMWGNFFEKQHNRFSISYDLS